MAHPYKVTAEPAVLPLAAADVKYQLKMDVAEDAANDPFYLTLIQIAVDVAEGFTSRDLITRTYTTYRDIFPSTIELRKCPVQSVESIKYYSNGVLVTVDPTIYYLTEDPDGFPLIALVDGKAWPSPLDKRLQAVQISFKAGYGDAASDVPDLLKQGMLQHIANLWTHRGDEDFPSDNGLAYLPAHSRLLYRRFKVAGSGSFT